MTGIRGRTLLPVWSVVMSRSDSAELGEGRFLREDGGRRRHLLRLIAAHFSGVRRLQEFRTAIPATGRTVYCSGLRPGGRGRQVLANPPTREVHVGRLRHNRAAFAIRLCPARRLQTAFSGCTSRHLAETPGRSAADRQSGSRSRIHSEIRFAVSSAFFGVSSHSHTTAKRHPADASAASASLSLSTFRSNFGIQYSRFDLGVVALEHPSCRCQKQP